MEDRVGGYMGVNVELGWRKTAYRHLLCIECVGYTLMTGKGIGRLVR